MKNSILLSLHHRACRYIDIFENFVAIYEAPNRKYNTSTSMLFHY